jgi:hypothetical protein
MEWYHWLMLYLIVAPLVFVCLFHGGNREPN